MRNVLILRKKDEFVRELEMGLRNRGVEVSLYQSQAQAEDALRQDRFDAVIFDIVVPDGDGIGFLRLCTSLDICSICITSFINDFVLFSCHNYGTDFVLSESLPIDMLVERIFLFVSVYQKRAECIPQKEPRNKNIVRILDSIGIRHNRLGFKYSEQALRKMLQCNNSLPLYKIYECVAKNEKTKPNCVERSIRSAIEEAWGNNSLVVVESIFGCSVKADKGKPTNKEFLSAIYEKIKLNL